MKTHPFADRFPMMDADELASLADDIKANGLIHPIEMLAATNEDRIFATEALRRARGNRGEFLDNLSDMPKAAK